MSTERQEIAAEIDAKIEASRRNYENLDRQALEAEQRKEIENFHKLRIAALNASNNLEYWLNYKQANQIIWQEETPPPLPDITKRKIKLWLLENGKDPKTAPAETIAKISDAKLQAQAEIEWEDGSAYSRESAFVKALAASLGWPDTAVDEVWKQIAAIE